MCLKTAVVSEGTAVSSGFRFTSTTAVLLFFLKKTAVVFRRNTRFL